MKRVRDMTKTVIPPTVIQKVLESESIQENLKKLREIHHGTTEYEPSPSEFLNLRDSLMTVIMIRCIRRSLEMTTFNMGK